MQGTIDDLLQPKFKVTVKGFRKTIEIDTLIDTQVFLGISASRFRLPSSLVGSFMAMIILSSLMEQ